MQSPTNEPRVILVGVDYSELGDLALARALELASTPGTELHLAHVITPPAAPYLVLGAASMPDARATLMRHAEKGIQAFAARFPDARAPARLVYHVRVDEPAHQLAQLASDVEADLIVVGTHGRKGAARLFLGSVAEVVVRLAPCQVLVVRPKAGGEQHRERLGQRQTHPEGAVR